MKLKNNWKRFWTLDRHHAAGFTLVELIVVIAILAILAGVGIPVYSGYITKANKQADLTLISDIEHALTVAGYSGTFEDGEGGYIMLSTEGVTGVEAGSNLEKALIDSFGNNYADVLKLKYNNWDNNGLANGLMGYMARLVKDSSYMTGNRVDSLLSDVEKMTGMAQHLVIAMQGEDSAYAGWTLSRLFTPTLLNSTAKKYGLIENDMTDLEWEAWGKKPENNTAYSNLLVLAAADDFESYANRTDDSTTLSPASELIMEFSSFYAFAATNPEFSKTLDKKLDELQNVDDAEEGKSWFNDLRAEANKSGFEKYMYDTDSNGAIIKDELGNPQISQTYGQDAGAFITIMTALGHPTEAQAGILSGDLSNKNLFTDGVGNTMYSDFLDTVDAVSAIPGNDYGTITVPVGSVALLYAQSPEGIVVTNTLPSA